MKFPKKLSFLLAVAAGTCWGTHGTFASLMGKYGISDDTIALIAPLFYGLFFFALLWKDGFSYLRFPLKKLPLMLLYGLSSAAYSYTIIKAYWHMPVGIVHTMVFCSMFLVMLLSRLVFKTPLTAATLLAACGSLVGIAMLLNIFGAGGWNAAGILWTLLALISWAVLVVIEKYWLEMGMNSNAILVYSAFFGVLFLIPIVSPIFAVQEICLAVAESHGAVLLSLLGFALITSVGAYFFYIEALKRMEPAYVQIGYIMDPLTATILGFLAFGQSLLPIQICGIAVILMVVIVVECIEIRNSKREKMIEKV